MRKTEIPPRQNLVLHHRDAVSRNVKSSNSFTELFKVKVREIT